MMLRILINGQDITNKVPFDSITSISTEYWKTNLDDIAAGDITLEINDVDETDYAENEKYIEIYLDDVKRFAGFSNRDSVSRTFDDTISVQFISFEKIIDKIEKPETLSWMTQRNYSPQDVINLALQSDTLSPYNNIKVGSVDTTSLPATSTGVMVSPLPLPRLVAQEKTEHEPLDEDADPLTYPRYGWNWIYKIMGACDGSSGSRKAVLYAVQYPDDSIHIWEALLTYSSNQTQPSVTDLISVQDAKGRKAVKFFRTHDYMCLVLKQPESVGGTRFRLWPVRTSNIQTHIQGVYYDIVDEIYYNDIYPGPKETLNACSVFYRMATKNGEATQKFKLLAFDPISVGGKSEPTIYEVEFTDDERIIAWGGNDTSAVVLSETDVSSVINFYGYNGSTGNIDMVTMNREASIRFPKREDVGSVSVIPWNVKIYLDLSWAPVDMWNGYAFAGNYRIAYQEVINANYDEDGEDRDYTAMTVPRAVKGTIFYQPSGIPGIDPKYIAKDTLGDKELPPRNNKQIVGDFIRKWNIMNPEEGEKKPSQDDDKGEAEIYEEIEEYIIKQRNLWPDTMYVWVTKMRIHDLDKEWEQDEWKDYSFRDTDGNEWPILDNDKNTLTIELLHIEGAEDILTGPFRGGRKFHGDDSLNWWNGKYTRPVKYKYWIVASKSIESEYTSCIIGDYVNGYLLTLDVDTEQGQKSIGDIQDVLSTTVWGYGEDRVIERINNIEPSLLGRKLSLAELKTIIYLEGTATDTGVDDEHFRADDVHGYIEDSTQNWEKNQWVGYSLGANLKSENSWQRDEIIYNNATQIYWDSAEMPEGGTEYKITHQAIVFGGGTDKVVGVSPYGTDGVIAWTDTNAYLVGSMHSGYFYVDIKKLIDGRGNLSQIVGEMLRMLNMVPTFNPTTEQFELKTVDSVSTETPIVIHNRDYDPYTYKEKRDQFDGVRIQYRDSERKQREARYPDVELKYPQKRRLPSLVGITTTLLKAISKDTYTKLSPTGMNVIEFDYFENGNKLSLGRAILLNDIRYLTTGIDVTVQDSHVHLNARRMS